MCQPQMFESCGFHKCYTLYPIDIIRTRSSGASCRAGYVHEKRHLIDQVVVYSKYVKCLNFVTHFWGLINHMIGFFVILVLVLVLLY